MMMMVMNVNVFGMPGFWWLLVLFVFFLIREAFKVKRS